jgi:hypothetical protein
LESVLVALNPTPERAHVQSTLDQFNVHLRHFFGAENVELVAASENLLQVSESSEHI